MNSQVPVLLVIFNRPEQTRRVIEALRSSKPTQLFVAADGPRQERDGEDLKCHLARQAAMDIDWSCNVETRFLDENIGCDPAVSSAIDWFFQHVDYGVILEDDCIPHPHFFRYCRELLDLYAHDERIMAINGFTPYPVRDHPYDYHFSRRFRSWGWGTWRRAWKYFSYDIDNVDEATFLSMIKAYYPFHYDRQPWLRRFYQTKKGELKAWDFRWEVACFSQSGLFVAPERSLITNIGFDADATHTHRYNPIFAKVQTYAIDFPLRHPPFVYADCVPEKSLQNAIYLHLSLKNRCGQLLRQAFGLIADSAQIRF